MMIVIKNRVIEFKLKSDCDYENPVWDQEVIAKFTSQTGRRVNVRAFWDGGRIWRIRFSPDELGKWEWCTECSHKADLGLHMKASHFTCVEYEGKNPLYKHGTVHVSQDNRRLAHKDGTPFFWLGDTAWNGVIRGDDDNWNKYLDTRVSQNFSVIQFVCCHWRGDAADENGETACDENHPIRINPSFFQRLDKRVEAINEKGLLAAPVAIWSLLQTDLGQKLKEEDCIQLASYIVSRYDAYHVVWLLGGDGNYNEIGIDRWKRIGRAVFTYGHKRPVSLHPCGANWPAEDFREEAWYGIIGYQSGHVDKEEDIAWLVKGPPATAWGNHPPLPVINMEPNYETAIGYAHKTVFTDYHVRRAAYWSLLVSPAAGITYGHDSVWNWNFETGPSEGHGNWHNGAVPPWHTGLDTPGIRNMTIMRDIIEAIDWPTLFPYTDILAEQPGDTDIASFIATGRNAAGTIVCYAPRGKTIRFKPELNLPRTINIVDPRTGTWKEAGEVEGSAITLPDDRDWLVVCGNVQG